MAASTLGESRLKAGQLDSYELASSSLTWLHLQPPTEDLAFCRYTSDQAGEMISPTATTVFHSMPPDHNLVYSKQQLHIYCITIRTYFTNLFSKLTILRRRLLKYK